MKRVVIVEDEKLVLLGIVSLFEGAREYEVVGSYVNPLKALEAVRTLDAEILITDITMPQMDGLSLIEQVKELKPSIHIIVISCYEDFSIVSRAFKLGVDDYLLKHEIEHSTLFDVLDALPISHEQHHQSVDAVNVETFLASAAGDEQYVTGGILSLLVFKKLYSSSCEPSASSINIYWCQQLVQALLDTLELGKAVIYKNCDILCLLKAGDRYREGRGRFFQEVRRQLGRYINRPVVIIKSSRGDRTDLPRMWEDLSSKRGCIYYQQGTRIVTADSEQCTLDSEHCKFPDPVSIFSVDSSSWEDQMHSMAAQILHRRTDPSILCMDILLYQHEIEQFTERLFGNELPAQADHTTFYTDIQAFDDALMLLDWFIAYVKKIQKSILSYQGQRRSVIRIKIFLHNHYREHLCLATLSEHFHLNENYLCEIFKKDTGIGYVDYLNSIRIDEAKRLIGRTDLTAEAICEMVGFSNASHFSRVFKRICGMTMTEYRETIG